MIVIFGYSALAKNIIELFTKNNKNVVIVEPIKDTYNDALKDNYSNEIYNYECMEDEDLIKLGIQSESIEALFCLHDDFNKNLFTTLSSRNLNKSLPIIALSSNHNDTTKLKLAGASKILNPYETTGLKIFRHIHRPVSLKIIDDILFSNSDLVIKEIQITKNSLLENKHIKDITLFKEYSLVLIGIQDKELGHNFTFASMGINHKLDDGDTIVVMGRENDIEKLKGKL
jgi:voltage-gated potassium channel